MNSTTNTHKPEFSLFANSMQTISSCDLTLSELIDGISNGKWKSEVEECRRLLTEEGKVEYNKYRKANVPAASLSAKLANRKQGTLENKGAAHSGLIQLDFDAKDHPSLTVDLLRQKVFNAPFVAACFLSLSGEGVKAIGFCPAEFDTHLGSWLAADEYFRSQGLIMDASTKDETRLSFVSYDPRAFYWDEATELTPLPVIVKTTNTGSSGGNEDPEHVRKVLKMLADKIGADQKRETWWHILSSTVDAVGEDLASEIVDDYFPPMEPNHDRASDIKSKSTGTWLSLRKYGIDPSDNRNIMPDQSGDATEIKPARKRLSDFLVNHSDTLNMTRQQIDALRPPFIIEGFIRHGEVLLLGAESKSKKSWLTQDAGFAVATGLPWLADVTGQNGFTTVRARVHVLDLELNPSEMRYRFAKARGNRFSKSQEESTAMTDNITAYSFDGQNMKEIMQHLEELKASVSPGDLVILDCLYRLVPDGNEVKEVAEILETVKRFASVTQAGVIVVDHFRKAGDEKARNRFAGSFVKQASASTLVAIEVTAADILVLNIDARTFHGCPKVHARFNPVTYAFNRLPDEEIEKAKQESKREEAEGWILRLWNGHELDYTMTTSNAVAQWGIKRQAAIPRLEKLVSRGWLTEKKAGLGKATEWKLAPNGVAIVNQTPDDI